MRVVVVLPTYNELENLKLLLPQLLDLPVEVCVVDDNSPDGTGALVDEWSAREPRVHAIHRAGKLGLGTAYIAGFKWALERGFDSVLTMDADFSHHPRHIPAMLERIEGADMVIGSRYVPGGELHYPFWRKMLSAGANGLARVALGLQPRDCTAGFRMYRARTLRGIPLDRIFSNGYSFLIETLTFVQGAGFTVAEVPIVFRDRERGTSKISSKEIFKAMYTVARLSARRVLAPVRAART